MAHVLEECDPITYEVSKCTWLTSMGESYVSRVSFLDKE